MSASNEPRVSDEDREALALQLVQQFSPEQLDPLYIAEFERSGLKVPAPVDTSTMISFIDSDGHRSMRTLTFGEIAEFLVSHGWGPKPAVREGLINDWLEVATYRLAAAAVAIAEDLKKLGIEVTE